MTTISGGVIRFNDHHYLSIRSYYGGYLGRYRGYYPRAYYRKLFAVLRFL